VQPSATLVERGSDRQGGRVIGGVKLSLPTDPVDDLPEIALTIKNADADNRDSKIAGGFQHVARQDAKTAGIKRQRLAKAEFHAEIRHPARHVAAICRSEPAGRLDVGFPRLSQALEFADELTVGGEG